MGGREVAEKSPSHARIAFGEPRWKPWRRSCDRCHFSNDIGAEIKVLGGWSCDTASLLAQQVVGESQCLYFLLFFNFFLFCDNEKMFKLPSLCLNTSSCWQQQEIPWSAVRWESAIFLESKQHVCQLEIIFCLLRLLVVVWWSRVTASDNSGVGNRKQAEKWVLDCASENRSLRFLTLHYCIVGEKPTIYGLLMKLLKQPLSVSGDMWDLLKDAPAF